MSLRLFLAASLMTLVLGCSGGEKTSRSTVPPNVMAVTVQAMEFTAPDEIPSGWVTFRFTNASDMTHFAIVERLPEGIGVAEQQREVAPVFQEGMDLLNAGQTEAAMAKFGELPEWFSRIQFLGGPGLLGPGHEFETTVHLEPGTYMLECYVKTVGVFHSFNPDSGAYGMVHEFEVKPASDAPEPVADVNLTISGAGGIQGPETLTAGSHTVGVRFEDQMVHENFVGHDVHVVRLEDDTDLDALALWMDWRQPEGLEDPPPAEFLGGLEEMPAGAVGYFTVQLEPGRYAWISEVPDPMGKGMLKEFTVTAGDH